MGVSGISQRKSIQFTYMDLPSPTRRIRSSSSQGSGDMTQFIAPLRHNKHSIPQYGPVRLKDAEDGMDEDDDWAG